MLTFVVRNSAQRRAEKNGITKEQMKDAKKNGKTEKKTEKTKTQKKQQKAQFRRSLGAV